MSANSTSSSDAAAVCTILRDAAHAAGEIALRFFRPGGETNATVQMKDNGSPVSEADVLCDQFLFDTLRPHFPEAGWLSEEIADDLARLGKRTVLVVDPIDGTRGFVAGDPRWTICIALLVDGRPWAGVVYAPALGETYVAAVGTGATLNGVPMRIPQRSLLAGSRAAGPRGLAAAIAREGTPLELVPKVPSLAYRLVSVASGALDVTFTSADAHDWDVAAGDIIVLEAGGRMTNVDGSTPRYNEPSTRHGVLVAASEALVVSLQVAVQRGLRAPAFNRPT